MTPQSAPTNKLASSPQWGQIVTPERWGREIKHGRVWCMDNGVFTGKFSPQVFWAKLEQMRPFRDSCAFVVAPDVVGNAIATMDSFRYWGPRIKAAGWPVAFVAQDGQELFPFPPTAEYDALFIGGSTDWKLSEDALQCIRRAQALGRWVHVGRVNSQKRVRHFQMAGVDSVDGTSVCFAPDKNYPVLDRQLRMRPLFRSFYYL